MFENWDVKESRVKCTSLGTEEPCSEVQSELVAYIYITSENLTALTFDV